VTLAPHDVAGREAAIRLVLGRVDDPELDEPVTDLRFIERIEIADDGRVAIGFRLPTYWCAANFAFLMADDMRREVATLPWVTHVEVTLGEHMYAETINRGLALGLGFQEAFGREASGELHTLRRAFLVKAFQRRQEALLTYLLGTGLAPTALVALMRDGLASLDLPPDGERLRARYLARRDVCAVASEPLAFVDADGAPLIADSLPAYLKTLSRIGINAEFNGALCRGLLAARYGEAPDGEPTLYDFARKPRSA
jgi:metal-sulfur cluster biosynthetic enzyme